MSVARRTALFSLGAALALVAVKLLVGFLTGSLGILAEAVHSGVDAAAALLTLYAVGVADRPADHEHPYGHGKAQNLSALGRGRDPRPGRRLDRARPRSSGCRAAGARSTPPGTRPRCSAACWSSTPRAPTTSARVARSEGSAALARQRRALRRRLRRHAARSSPDSALTALGHPRADAIAALFVAVLVVLGAVRLARSNVNALMDSAPAGAEAQPARGRRVAARRDRGARAARPLLGRQVLRGCRDRRRSPGRAGAQPRRHGRGRARGRARARPPCRGLGARRAARGRRAPERARRRGRAARGRSDRGAQRDGAHAPGRSCHHAARARRCGSPAGAGGDDHASGCAPRSAARPAPPTSTSTSSRTRPA